MAENSSQEIRDVVAPIISVERKDGDFEYERLEGTLFLIGKRGFAISAAHVIRQISGDGVAAFVNKANKWKAAPIIGCELHPDEDVAIVKLEGIARPSWLTIGGTSENQSCKYDAWGYPIVVAEQAAKYEEGGKDRPELIYTSGYVRRRISRPLPSRIFAGKCFYELSEQAGHGCSGGPVILQKSLGRSVWEVFGVYVGECDAGFQAGYAVRSDAFYSWRPRMLGRSVQEESLDI
jgi:hypothetical protein